MENWKLGGGFRPLLVSLAPLCAQSAPVIVIAHGAGGRGEIHCAFWQRKLGNAAHLVCLRGRPKGLKSQEARTGSYFPEHHFLGRLLQQTQATIADKLGRKQALYMGFSQGATMGALALYSQPSFFPHLLLMEGGYGDWSPSHRRQFAHSGGRSLSFGCGRSKCASPARRAIRALQDVPVETGLVYEPRARHGYRKYLADGVLGSQLPWIKQLRAQACVSAGRWAPEPDCPLLPASWK